MFRWPITISACRVDRPLGANQAAGQEAVETKGKRALLRVTCLPYPRRFTTITRTSLSDVCACAPLRSLLVIVIVSSVALLYVSLLSYALYIVLAS